MTQEIVSIAIGFLTVIFNVPVVLYLVARASKKHDENEKDTRALLQTLQLNIAKLDKDHAVIESNLKHIESKVRETALLSNIVSSAIRKLDKLDTDVNRAWEAVRELKQ